MFGRAFSTVTVIPVKADYKSPINFVHIIIIYNIFKDRVLLNTLPVFPNLVNAIRRSKELSSISFLIKRYIFSAFCMHSVDRPKGASPLFFPMLGNRNFFAAPTARQNFGE